MCKDRSHFDLGCFSTLQAPIYFYLPERLFSFNFFFNLSLFVRCYFLTFEKYQFLTTLMSPVSVPTALEESKVLFKVLLIESVNIGYRQIRAEVVASKTLSSKALALLSPPPKS